ncbi:MAG: hypothetical protein KKC55_13905 [Gammaproteobacteria bacterium]|nr:hypothetical protein [Gammaproteobacteria bacterium]
MKRKIKVVAIEAFTDALTGRDYKHGDKVDGWDSRRAALYQMRGLVECQDEGPGPEEKKPAGPSEAKDEGESA